MVSRCRIVRFTERTLRKATRLNIILEDGTHVQIFSSHDEFFLFARLDKGDVVTVESDYVANVKSYKFHINPRLINPRKGV